MTLNPLTVCWNRVECRRAIVFTWHVVGVVLSYLFAFLLRFDFALTPINWVQFWTYLPVAMLVYFGVFVAFRLYRGIWSYFSFQESLKVFPALFLGTGLFVTLSMLMRPLTGTGVPRSVYALMLLLLLSWEFGGRFLIRWLRQHVDRSEVEEQQEHRCLILGDTANVSQVLRGARTAIQDVGHIVGVLNDDLRRRGLSIDGVSLIGSPEEAGRLAKSMEITKMLLLPPYDSPRAMNQIVDAVNESGANCAMQVIPSFQDLASGRVNISIRDVEIEDLLDREPAAFDRSILQRFLHERSVLITGAGGSIGSEICRQVCTRAPACVVLFEQSEFALFEIERELRRAHPDLDIIAYAGDIRRAEDVRDAIRKAGGVDIVFHAAAYKHVHLMEKNIPSCFDNNVLGSVTLAETAEAEGIKDLIMISSDKAVRPTSVMGASKRIAERCVLESSTPAMTRKAVRFGNVLGSSGSVVPLFKEQIRNGGPVTVTTEDTRRYFMTIPEAVELVLMASAVGRDRDVMVLEMGAPVKIIDLARRLIRLSGFVPEEDIPITFIGLRPGEKEYEELLTEDENVVKTAHDKIWVLAKNEDAEALPPINLQEVRKLVRTKNRDGLLMFTMASIKEHRLNQLDLSPVKVGVERPFSNTASVSGS